MGERYRWPWYWLIVLAALAIAGTVAITATSRSRVHAIEDNFAAGQMLRLQGVEHAVDDFFAHAVQMADTDAAMSVDTVGDEALVRWYVRETFVGRADSHVFGLGVFYEPYAFDRRSRLFNVYDHVKVRRRHSQFEHEHDGFDEVIFRGSGRGTDDYTKDEWYRSAISSRGVVGYYGPYDDLGTRYISVTKSFYRRGAVAGVVSVDATEQEFRGLLMTGINRTDIAWVARPGARPFVVTAPLPHDESRYRDAQTPLRYSRARVHLTSDLMPVVSAERDTWTTAVVAIAAIWILTIITGVGLVQRWRSIEATRRLERDQERLEAEIAVARGVESELRKVAFTDELTALSNRRAFLDAVSAILALRDRVAHAVFLLDLDHFNITNETLGHPAGDELLRVIAQRLRSATGGNALVARLGGDEFVVLSACSADAIDSIASHLLSCIAEPVILYGRTIYPHASIGVAALGSEYTEPQEVLRDADIAMYAAKAAGRARHAIFDREMREQLARDTELELDLRRAIERGEIVPFYQPIVDLRTHQTVSFEALARWNRAGEHVPASTFVPFAESRGFVHQIDAAMVRVVLTQVKAVSALFPGAAIAINVSAPELTTPEYASELSALLREHEVAPEQIRLEITETTMMRTDEAHETLRRLADDGIRVVLDDFGTGYSSLAYLQRLSISGFKIDRSFVEHIDHDERAREIVRSIVALADVLGLTTTAEGVERASQVHELALLGVKYGQGFFFSSAVSIAALADLRMPDEHTALAKLGE